MTRSKASTSRGQCDLVEIAQRAGVQRVILILFPNVDVEFPLQSAKRAVEDRLRSGTMGYTISQPTFVTEVWLSPALGFDVEHTTARIYGAGQNKISWISFRRRDRDDGDAVATSCAAVEVCSRTPACGGLTPVPVRCDWPTKRC